MKRATVSTLINPRTQALSFTASRTCFQTQLFQVPFEGINTRSSFSLSAMNKAAVIFLSIKILPSYNLCLLLISALSSY